MKGWGRRRTSETAGAVVETVLRAIVLAALLASSVAVVTVARTIDIAPKVGDVLVFRAGARIVADWEFAVVTDFEPGPGKLQAQARRHGVRRRQPRCGTAFRRQAPVSCSLGRSAHHQ